MIDAALRHLAHRLHGAGATEKITVEGAKDADIVLVEGQGSINHPGYSGVTLGLLHGSCPNALILCHQASRTHLSEYRAKAWLAMPPLGEYIRLYEELGSAVWPTKVIGISRTRNPFRTAR